MCNCEEHDHENRLYIVEGENKLSKEKINELIRTVNHIALYYESKGDYIGNMEDLK